MARRCSNCCERGHYKSTCKSEPLTGTRCGYCRKRGHSRWKCELLTEDWSNYIPANAKHRKDVIAYFTENGIGVGTLLQGDKDSTVMYMVTDINWNNVYKDIRVKGGNQGFFQGLKVHNVKSGEELVINADVSCALTAMSYGILCRAKEAFKPPTCEIWNSGDHRDDYLRMFGGNNRKLED